jgi:molybdenum cofactor cytidylyltransferase
MKRTFSTRPIIDVQRGEDHVQPDSSQQECRRRIDAGLQAVTAMHRLDDGVFTGILLAAGRGARFDPSGTSNKLLQMLDDGTPVALAAARNLLTVLPHVVAVVRPDCDALAQQLAAAGCRISVCEQAEQGMAASLVHALKATRQAQGWVIALADMPWVQPATIAALVDAIDEGAQIAVPTWQGERGNPVAFSRGYLPELLALRGDTGARKLLAAYPAAEIKTNDPGIRRDVDTRGDLDAASGR